MKEGLDYIISVFENNMNGGNGWNLSIPFDSEMWGLVVKDNYVCVSCPSSDPTDPPDEHFSVSSNGGVCFQNKLPKAETELEKSILDYIIVSLSLKHL